MAEILLGIVTEIVLTKLISLGNQWISGLIGVNEDLQKLTKQFEMIQALLYDAEEKTITSKVVKVWLRRLEIVSNDADNLLDEISFYQIVKKFPKERKDKVCIHFLSSNSLVFRFKMFSKIKRIIFQINEIYKTANQIGLRPTKIMNIPSDPRKVQMTDPFLGDSKVIGRDDDLRDVIKILTSRENNLFVMGIVGMPGLGKTTLAKLLVNDNKIKHEFGKNILWICVSEDFDVDKILKEMLQSVTGEPSQLDNRQAIVNRLTEELEGKRFFLVLDDVWNESSELWGSLKRRLQSIEGSKGSKIVVTTRSDLVVTKMDGFHYPLRTLSERTSQELFEKIAFGSGKVRKTLELVKIGERIADRCGGVPLALKAMGGLMSTRRDALEWQRIVESNTWNLLDGVRSAIKLSFDHLQSLSIKQCLIYCSVFPKDSVINKKDLIQQWMAHGLLNPLKEDDLQMEVMGNNYFEILLQRSFLEVAETDATCEIIISCKMHDLVHDFATETSKGRSLTAKASILNNDKIKNIVHLSISLFNEGDFPFRTLKNAFSRLRTLHLSGVTHLLCRFLDECNCKHLRVLSITDKWMYELPISIAKMKHLRYLDIGKTGICANNFPKFFTKLYHLQTIKLKFMRTLPKDFMRFFNLRHLNVTENISCSHRDHYIPWISKFDHLRTLNCFPISRKDGCHIEELFNLNYLEGNLQIAGLDNVETQDDARKANLSQKCYIDRLILQWGKTNNDTNHSCVLEGLQPHAFLKALTIKNFMGTSLASWISTLENLMSLCLEDLEKCEKIPALGHLPSLKVLQISGMKCLECISNDFYSWPTSSIDSTHQSTSCSSIVIFPSLSVLKFSSMKCLKEWSFLSSSNIVAFPNLLYVDIMDCSSLINLPQELFTSSTNLVQLTITSCSELVECPNMFNFCSLTELIISCPKLKALPLGIDACTSLRSLVMKGPVSVIQSLILPYLKNLKKLQLSLSNNIIDPYNNDSPSSSNLESNHYFSSNVEDLILSGEPQLKSLPEQIQHFSSLKSLIITMYDGLETIPEWICKFHSLEKLFLYDCRSLANLPPKQVISIGLKNLILLEIYKCPMLSQSYEKETSAEWFKIIDNNPSIYVAYI